MSTKKSAYGQPAGDTDFRKKYDLDEYAAKAKAREAEEREERKARYEAKLAGKRYHKPLDGSETLSEARTGTRDFSGLVGTTTLIPAGAGTGKRGRGAGFYCEACDLRFPDNKQFIEHANTMQHQRATGRTGEVRRASAAEVHARIEALWERLQERKKDEVVDLGTRLALRHQEDEKAHEERRQKEREARERRRLQKEEADRAKTEYGEDVRVEGEHDEDDMMAAMGITNFGSSKKN